MPDFRRLVVLDPGHFHAALVQREMYPRLSPRAHVYAALGPDLIDYLGHIARFNRRAEAPTRWALDVMAGPDFLDRIAAEPAGGVAIVSGRNGPKIERIEAVLAAGLHVLADEPAIIRREDLPRLAAALDRAAARRLIVADMMTGRHDVVGRVVRLLRRDCEVFGEAVSGTPDEPAAALSGVHHLMKRVAGVPNRRPAWYFDIAQQGEGLADTGVHLVDRAHETLFPDEALDWRRDIEILSASRWPTRIDLAQFQQLTGEAAWPKALLSWVSGDALEYFCNGRVDYRVRGHHVRLEVAWEWEASTGDDRHEARYRGTRSCIELRQGAAEGWRPEIYVVPEAEIAAPLERLVISAQAGFPGLAVERCAAEWRMRIPDALRLGHDAHFARFAAAFLGEVENSATVPAAHKTNLLAKYFVTTEAVALSRS